MSGILFLYGYKIYLIGGFLSPQQGRQSPPALLPGASTTVTQDFVAESTYYLGSDHRCSECTPTESISDLPVQDKKRALVVQY